MPILVNRHASQYAEIRGIKVPANPGSGRMRGNTQGWEQKYLCLEPCVLLSSFISQDALLLFGGNSRLQVVSPMMAAARMLWPSYSYQRRKCSLSPSRRALPYRIAALGGTPGRGSPSTHHCFMPTISWPPPAAVGMRPPGPGSTVLGRRLLA